MKGSAEINMEISRDRMSQPQTAGYTAAKGGISALTHALAVSFAGKVRVNSVSPGWIDTAFTRCDGPDAIQQPGGRVEDPMDVPIQKPGLISQARLSYFVIASAVPEKPARWPVPHTP